MSDPPPAPPTDIYAVLSNDDPIELDDSAANALVMDIFANDFHPLSTKNSSSPFPSATTTNFNQDFMNFDNNTLFDMDYNPFDTFSPRRHSIAVTSSSSSSTNTNFDLNLRLLYEQQQHQQQQECEPHRASMPNIFSVINEPPPPVIMSRKRSLSQELGPSQPQPQQHHQGRRQSVASPQDISTWNHMITNKKLKTSEETVLPTIDEAVDYPIITKADLEAAKKDTSAIPRRQNKRFEDDTYTPKWVRYSGQSKEGYCDTCKPGKWLQLKNSAFWYHKQFFHGISSVSGRPFQEPLEHRTGENDVNEGLCHQCKQFVPLCNSKRKNSVLWYRHAHKCHVYDKPRTATKGPQPHKKVS